MTIQDRSESETNITAIEPQAMAKTNRFLLILVGFGVVLSSVALFASRFREDDRASKLRPYFRLLPTSNIRVLDIELSGTRDVDVSAEVSDHNFTEIKDFVASSGKLNGLTFSQDGGYMRSMDEWRAEKNRFYYTIRADGESRFSISVNSTKPPTWIKISKPSAKVVPSHASAASPLRSGGKHSSTGSPAATPTKMVHTAP